MGIISDFTLYGVEEHQIDDQGNLFILNPATSEAFKVNLTNPVVTGGTITDATVSNATVPDTLTVNGILTVNGDYSSVQMAPASDINAVGLQMVSNSGDGSLALEARTPVLLAGGIAYALCLFTSNLKPLVFGTDGIARCQIDANGVFFPYAKPTASAPAYVAGGMYFDTTLNKLRIGGASGWETVTSV